MLANGAPMFGPFPGTGLAPKVEREATKSLEQLAAAAATCAQPTACGATQASADRSTDGEVHRLTVESAKKGSTGPSTPPFSFATSWAPTGSPRGGLASSKGARSARSTTARSTATTRPRRPLRPSTCRGSTASLALPSVGPSLQPIVKDSLGASARWRGTKGRLHADWLPRDLALVGRNLDLKKAYSSFPLTQVRPAWRSHRCRTQAS